MTVSIGLRANRLLRTSDVEECHLGRGLWERMVDRKDRRDYKMGSCRGVVCASQEYSERNAGTKAPRSGYRAEYKGLISRPKARSKVRTTKTKTSATQPAQQERTIRGRAQWRALRTLEMLKAEMRRGLRKAAFSM